MWKETPVPEPGEALWDWLIACVAEHPRAPTVPSYWTEQNLPRLRPAAAQAVTGPARRLGRPPRDPGDARDIALAWDIEGFRPSPDRSWHDQLRNRHRAVGGIRGEHAVTFVTHPDKCDDRTERHWRDAGRRSWAALGAWPWALIDNGKLTKTWWKRPAYPDGLRYWAATR